MPPLLPPLSTAAVSTFLLSLVRFLPTSTCSKTIHHPARLLAAGGFLFYFIFYNLQSFLQRNTPGKYLL